MTDDDQDFIDLAHVTWFQRPVLHRPTMIVAFTGWNDAGDAASNGVRQLIDAWHATPLAELDPEEFTDFATVRPHVRLTPGGQRSIVWPTVGLWAASSPGGDAILVLGPEPALRWRMFCQQIVGVAQRYGTGMVISLGALLADAPHTRPIRVIGTSSQPETQRRFDLTTSRYQGPTGIVGVLHDAFAATGIATASLWAAVPAYAPQVPAPNASVALLQRVAGMVGSPSPTGALRDDADGYMQRVDDLIDQDVDLIAYVRRLESMYDDGSLGDDLADDDDNDDDDDDDDDDDRTSRPPVFDPNQLTLAFDGDEQADDQDAHDGQDDGEDPGDPSGGTTGAAPDLVSEVEQFLREQGG